MTDPEVLAKLRDIMQKSSPVSVDWQAVTPETTIASIGFDSLSVLDLVYDIQQTFGLEFDAEEMAGVKTVGDLVRFLRARQTA
jgi:acyl carrier protein